MMPVIKCRCGFELMVVPDKEKMSTAIMQHAEDHAKLWTDPRDRAGARAMITNELTQQVLIALAGPIIEPAGEEEKKVKCPFCSKKFTTTWEMIKHDDEEHE